MTIQLVDKKTGKDIGYPFEWSFPISTGDAISLGKRDTRRVVAINNGKGTVTRVLLEPED